jgi:hypothetical protein
MSENEPQSLIDEYSRATKILDAEYKPASLDDVVKTCEDLHVEEQHQLKILLQKYEHLFDGTLGEFNMNTIPISLQRLPQIFFNSSCLSLSKILNKLRPISMI